MARFNEILVGRYNRFVQKHFSMKGPASLASISDEMMPIWAFRNGVENLYLEAFDRFGTAVAIAAVAAQVQGARLRNPAGSNVVVIVEKFSASASPASQLNWSYGPLSTDLSTPMSIGQLDSRGRTSTSMIVSQGSAASITGGTIIFAQNGLALTNYDLIWDANQEIAILPGQMLQVVTNNVNTLLTVGMYWRERFLEDSERT